MMGVGVSSPGVWPAARLHQESVIGKSLRVEKTLAGVLQPSADGLSGRPLSPETVFYAVRADTTEAMGKQDADD